MIRLLLVDDHPALREGLAVVLSQSHDLEVVAQAGTGTEALGAFSRSRPDVVVLDLRLPDRPGVEVCAALRKQDPRTRVLVLSTFDSLDERMRAFAAGAAAFLRKDSTAAQIANAIRSVHAGQRLVPDDVAELLVAPSLNVSLSQREQEIVRLAAQGKSNRVIAAELSISPETVKTLFERARDKLGARDRTEAVARAIKLGLLEP